MQTISLNPVPGLSFLAEENGKPCHRHMLNGVEIPGCTSVSGLFQEDGWKFAWPPKLMAEQLKQTWLSGVAYEQHQIDGRLQVAKNAWRVKRDKSADTGTIAHKFIEEYINNGTRLFFCENKEVQHCFDQFISWEEKYGPEWLASEVQIGSAKHRFAGILDALARIDGNIILLDFKTSGDIKDDYTIQLAGLCLGLEEMGLKVDARAILHLPKEGESEFSIIDSDLEKDQEDFLAGLNFYNHKNMFMGRMKSDRRTNRANKAIKKRLAV